MEEGNKDILIGKNLKIIYDDSSQSPVIKIGRCISRQNDFLQILTEKGINEFLVPSRIIRIEVLNGLLK